MNDPAIIQSIKVKNRLLAFPLFQQSSHVKNSDYKCRKSFSFTREGITAARPRLVLTDFRTFSQKNLKDLNEA